MTSQTYLGVVNEQSNYKHQQCEKNGNEKSFTSFYAKQFYPSQRSISSERCERFFKVSDGYLIGYTVKGITSFNVFKCEPTAEVTLVVTQ